jgi:acetyl esterase
MGNNSQYMLVRVLARLPDRVKIALSGEPAIVIDGQRLDPMVQLLRGIRRRRGFAGLLHPSIEAGRRRYRRETRVFRGPTTPVGHVREFEIPACGRPLRVRHYAPPGRGSPSLLVYLHGGGFVIGDLDTHDEPCRLLCRYASTHVLSVEYRLAPEHPFPAAVDDAQSAFLWARANATALGCEPRHVAIGGDSAGANLATVAALAVAPDERPAAQLLIYPATDVATDRASHSLFGETYLLTRADRDAFFRHYAGHVSATDPRVSPLRAGLLASAPRAFVVVAGFDILRDEGDAYADALRNTGVAVRVLRFPALEHGFIHLTGVSPVARRAVEEIAANWRNFTNAH